MAIKARPPYYPSDEFAPITPSDSLTIKDSITTSPDDGVQLHNYGVSGLVFVDGALGGVNVPLFLAQGAFVPVRVKKVYLTNLGAGVLLVACW